MKRCSVERVLLAVSGLLIAGVLLAGLFAWQWVGRVPCGDRVEDAANPFGEYAAPHSPGFWMTWHNRVVDYGSRGSPNQLRLGSRSVIPRHGGDWGLDDPYHGHRADPSMWDRMLGR
jgi:hypothetical protein